MSSSRSIIRRFSSVLGSAMFSYIVRRLLYIVSQASLGYTTNIALPVFLEKVVVS